MSDIEPVRATATVHRAIDEAFAVFTEDIGRWWPVGSHSVGTAADVAETVLEREIGGRFYERWHDGTTHVRGQVLAWEPPSRVVLAWATPGDTEVAVEFEAFGPTTTKLRLEHRGWERLAEGAAEERAPYDEGPGAWSGVLTCFVDGATDPGCHRAFAVGANQLVWRLLARSGRTADEDETMVHAAHASTWHWAAVGEPVNQARGEWLASHVYAVLGRGEPATHHARRSLAICEANDIGDFDLAYAHEGVARAAAAASDLDAARRHRAEAARVGAEIADPEDRSWFDKDLAAGPWFDLA